MANKVQFQVLNEADVTLDNAKTAGMLTLTQEDIKLGTGTKVMSYTEGIKTNITNLTTKIENNESKVIQNQTDITNINNTIKTLEANECVFDNSYGVLIARLSKNQGKYINDNAASPYDYDIFINGTALEINKTEHTGTFTDAEITVDVTNGLTITTNNTANAKSFYIIDNSGGTVNFTFNGSHTVKLYSYNASSFNIATNDTTNVTAIVESGNQGSGEYIKSAGTSQLNITLNNFNHNGLQTIKSTDTSNMSLNLKGTTKFTNGGFTVTAGNIVNVGYIHAIGSSTLNLHMYDTVTITNGSANGVIAGCVLANSATATLNVNMYDNSSIEGKTSNTQSLVAVVSNPVTGGKVNVTMNDYSTISIPEECNPLTKDVFFNNGIMTVTMNDYAKVIATTKGKNRITNFRNEDQLTLTMNGQSSLVHPLAIDAMTKTACNINDTYILNIVDNRPTPAVTVVGVEDAYSGYVQIKYSGADQATYYKRI